MSTKIWKIARRIHHNVELALWATLSAVVIFLMVFVLPYMPEIQAQYARVRALEVSAENAELCEKLNIKRGTERYDQCLLDVGQFRWKAEQRIYGEIAPW